VTKTTVDAADGQEPETRDGVQIALDMLSQESNRVCRPESAPTSASLAAPARSTRTLICDQAAEYAQAEFRKEYGSTACAVCGKEKWSLHPFCRDCSIKLQRAGLMQHLVRLVVWNSNGKREPEHWDSQVLVWYSKVYDRCRDFLIVTKRIPMHRKIQDLD